MLRSLASSLSLLARQAKHLTPLRPYSLSSSTVRYSLNTQKGLAVMDVPE
jgi:hypothetical protein